MKPTPGTHNNTRSSAGSSKNPSGSKYADIISLPHPVSAKHPHMSVSDRAKQFAPFAALKGHMETLKLKEKIVVPRAELSDDMKELLDERLHILEAMLSRGEHPIITVTYFYRDKYSPDEQGEYRKKTGMTARLDPAARLIQIVDTKILFENIRRIEGAIF